MGYDFSKFVSKKPFTGEVEKTFDPSVIQGQFKGMTQDEIREYKRCLVLVKACAISS